MTTPQLPPGHETPLLDDPQHPIFPPKKSARGKAIVIGILILLTLATLFFVGYLPRRNREKSLASGSQEEKDNIPVVNVTRAKRAPAQSQLMLPGNITAMTEASIYARAAGYLKRRYADIGDRVKQGQLLAEIDAPDLDAQVSQGRAAVSQAQSALAQQQAAQVQTETAARLAKVQLDRWAVLVNRGVLARQELDQKQADYDSAIATVEAAKSSVRASEGSVRGAQANLQRLIRLQDYKRVVAPFTGVITARNVDVGALISNTGSSQGTPAGPGSTSTGEMFREAQIDVLRVMVNVPQGDAPSISVGQRADVRVDQYLGRLFTGAVSRTASSLDPATRTLLTEVRVPNRDGALLPGEYGQVRFDIHRSTAPLLVPGDSLISRPTGTMIAVIDAENKAHFRGVTIGRDYGTDIEISSGLEDGDTVVVNPSDDVREGATLKPQMIKPPGQTPGAPGGASDRRPGGIGSSPLSAPMNDGAKGGAKSQGSAKGGSSPK